MGERAYHGPLSAPTSSAPLWLKVQELPIKQDASRTSPTSSDFKS